MNILVTDAEYKHTLAAVRSLGSKGHYVIAGSTSPSALSFHSKFCNERLLYPNPQNEQEFIDFLMEYGMKHKVDVILPVGYNANVAVSRNKKILNEIAHIPVADFNAMQIALNKKKSMEFAQECGIQIPQTYSSPENLQNFPIVVKHVLGTGNVRFINNKTEFSNIDLRDTLI
ncbi:MAG: hypothetical protein LUP99_02270, partial [Methanomicrobiales archaeon]|nr:hypothetical protein [Methanomicrobiales archaeon]